MGYTVSFQTEEVYNKRKKSKPIFLLIKVMLSNAQGLAQ